MGQKHLLKQLSKADYITIFSLFLIVNAFWLLWNQQTYLAIAVTFVSMYFDYLDGKIARQYGGSPYGKVLDSLYDMLGWVLFPALTINIQTNFAWWSVLVTTAFCLSSAIRLSRFTVDGYIKKNQRYYVGMPVSYSRYALLVVLLAGSIISVLILCIMIPLMVSSRLFRKSPAFLMQLNLLYALIFVYLELAHG